MNNLIKFNEYHDLYDCYSSLLTETQRLYFENYYFEDLSLSEIAQNLDVSRNAVHSNLQKTILILKKYEEKLKLIEKKAELTKVILQLNDKYMLTQAELLEISEIF